MKLTNPQISGLCRGLALMLHAGISLADGAFLMAQEEQGAFQDVLNHLGRSLDAGKMLSQTMEEMEIFPRLVTGMVLVGERTGRMEESLEGLASFYEERQRIAHRLRSSLAYPGMILILMLAVVGVLLIRVLPVFDQVYVSLGSRLTGLAAGLLQLGQILESALPVVLVLLMLVVAGVVLYGCWASFRERCDALWQNRFGDRGIARKFNNAQFARAMAMGLGSGLALEEALELASLLLSDIPGAAERCRICTQELSRGASLAEALGKAELLRGGDCRMLTVGCKGGNSDRVMEEIADRLLAEAEEALDVTISSVEPAMVLAASVLVGIILLSVMLPLMNIMSALG